MTLPPFSPEAARYIGYFSSPDQHEPAYDPGPEAPCPLCGGPISAAEPRTISLLPEGAPVCLFYRVHKLCDELLERDEALDLDRRMLDLALGSEPDGEAQAQEEQEGAC